MCCGGWVRTTDLWVMSLPGYRCPTPPCTHAVKTARVLSNDCLPMKTFLILKLPGLSKSRARIFLKTKELPGIVQPDLQKLFKKPLRVETPGASLYENTINCILHLRIRTAAALLFLLSAAHPSFYAALYARLSLVLSCALPALAAHLP
jgi:hypothetical protein